MPISFLVRQYTQEALDFIMSNSSHAFTPVHRKAFYDMLSLHSGDMYQRIRGFIALESAQHVLPIFYQSKFAVDAMPERVYALPQTTIDLAKRILQKETIQRSIVQNIMDQGYESFGILIQEASDAPEMFPVNAVWAGKTAHVALLEVLGIDIFQNLQTHIVVGRTLEGKLQYDSWQNVSDEVFVLRTDGDAAGAAALAFASSATNTICNPLKLQEFWEWWLTKAIPQAWELAENSSGHT